MAYRNIIQLSKAAFNYYKPIFSSSFSPLPYWLHIFHFIFFQLMNYRFYLSMSSFSPGPWIIPRAIPWAEWEQDSVLGLGASRREQKEAKLHSYHLPWKNRKATLRFHNQNNLFHNSKILLNSACKCFLMLYESEWGKMYVVTLISF